MVHGGAWGPGPGPGPARAGPVAGPAGSYPTRWSPRGPLRP